MNPSRRYGKRSRVSGTSPRHDLINFTSTSQTACFPPFPRQQLGKEGSDCLSVMPFKGGLMGGLVCARRLESVCGEGWGGGGGGGGGAREVEALG